MAQSISTSRRFRALNRLNPPRTLYHYTDASGALGILSKGQIWASDAFFLNDTSELQYGLDILHDVWTEVRKGVETAKKGEWLDCVLGLMHESFADHYSTYLSCFCEKGNLLSQWRGYGKVGSGFALGFDRLQLEQCAFGFQLVEVEYEEDRQRERCKAYLSALCAELTDDQLSSENLKDTYSVVEADLLTYVVSFKNRAFSEELEWRLVQIHPTPEVPPGLEFRVSNGRIIPYLPVTFYDPTGAAHLPLVSVTVGPGLEGSIGERSIRELLKKCGPLFREVGIEQCGLPYRI
jgi:hypothetical protein